jgi:hypothetical protein
MIVTAGVLEFFQTIRESYTVLFCMLCYVSDFAGLTSEHQFVAFMHTLKRTVQNWNNHIDVVSDNDLINNQLHRNLMNGQKSVLFTVSNKKVTSKREKIHSIVVHFQKLR